MHQLALRIDAGLGLPAAVADLPLELLGIIEISKVHPDRVKESQDAGNRKANPPEHGVEFTLLARLLERPEGFQARKWSHIGLIMHVVEHLVDAKALQLLLGLSLLRLYLSVELLAVYLAVDIEGLHGLIHACRSTVVYTIKEDPMASLQKMRTSSNIIVLHHFPPERRQFVRLLLLHPAQPLPVVRRSLIVPIGPLRKHLQAQGFLRQFWAFEYITQLRRADHASVLVLRLQLLASEMALFEVQLQVVLRLELLVAYLALEGGPILSSRREPLELLGVWSEVAQHAEVTLRYHGHSILFEDGLDLRVDAVEHVLGVYVGAVVILERVLARGMR